MNFKTKISVFVFIFGVISIANFLGTYAYFKDDVEIYFNGWGLDAEDDKLVILVDVPSNGGEAVKYFMYEIYDNDDWWFDEARTGNTHEGAVEIYLHHMDFLIIVNSDSDDDGNWDDFNVVMTVYDSGESSTTIKYEFGDSAGNDLLIAVFQLDGGYLSFSNDGKTVASYRNDGVKGSDWSVYSDADWADLWNYLDDYFSSGEENEVEDMLKYCDFPAPA
ncbi:MAG: hypothetical protein ACTSQE_10675 [Candidatus Heimdallarchaeaceae archaeon]